MWYSIYCLPCVHTGIYPSNSTGIVWWTMSEFRWVFPEVYFWMLEFQLQMSDVVICCQLKFTWHIYDHLEIYDFHLAKLNIKYKCLKFVCLNWILFKNTWISSQNVWKRPRKGVVMHQLIIYAASLNSKYQYQLCCWYYRLPIDSITYLHCHTFTLVLLHKCLSMFSYEKQYIRRNRLWKSSSCKLKI